MIPQHILDAVEAERAEVRATVATEAQDDLHTALEWGGLLTRHVGLGMPHSGSDPADLERLERQMVRVMWLAVACLESLQRKKDRAAVAGPTDEARAAWKGW